MKVKKLIKLLCASDYICIMNKQGKIVYQDNAINAASATPFHNLNALYIRPENGMLIVFTDKE